MAKLKIISVLPKLTLSAQTVENSHSFFKVSYTWYKSLNLSNDTLLISQNLITFLHESMVAAVAQVRLPVPKVMAGHQGARVHLLHQLEFNLLSSFNSKQSRNPK